MTTAFNDDWAHYRPGDQILARWAATETDLAGLTLDQIMHRARGAAEDLAVSDATLAALYRLAAHDPLARRTALQAVLPRLVHTAQGLTRRPAHASITELVSDLAAIAWQDIADAAGRWPSHLAAQLVRAVERHHGQTRGFGQHEHPVADIGSYVATSGGEPHRAEHVDVERLIRGAVRRGVITPEAGRILERVAYEGLTDAQIAAHHGGTAAATKKARQRAVLALRSHTPALALLAG